ncbi:MAG TPA: hypothetical protein VNU97_01790 [Rhizomicrobium sp.]|jgi:hypothetical protein|nr:hypothetical protein [Rhizomicrobium sp.]
MRKLYAALCAALLFGCAVSARATDDSLDTARSSVGDLRQSLQAVIAKSQEAGADEAAMSDTLKAILADPAFRELSEQEHHTAYLLYGAVLYDLGRNHDAQALIKQATAMPQADGFDWHLRLSNSYRLADYADAARSTATLASRWPEKLSDISFQAIETMNRETQKDPTAAEVGADMLAALHAMKWQPDDPFETPDGLWLTLLRIRLERHDIHGARDLADELRAHVPLLQMHADRRFDALVQADPRHFDVMKAYGAELADLKAKAAAAPDKLEGVNTVAELLLNLDRAPEAMALITGALARLAAKPDAFSDAGDKLNWTLDVRSRILFALGRSDDALAALAEGASHKEDGAVNVSQAINLADAYEYYDRPNDALAAVAALDFSNASRYGRMALEDARACALFELGNTAALGQVLDYMKAHTIDGARPYLNTMLFTGDLDGAAAEIIAELNDPARRLDTLYYLQDYLPRPHASKREDAVHAAWLAMRARPDVSGAIARVGRIESYAMLSPTY